MQLPAPAAEEEPAAQGLHEVALERENEPALHWTGASEIDAHDEPAGHVVQLEAPPRLYLPATQLGKQAAIHAAEPAQGCVTPDSVIGHHLPVALEY